MPDSTSLTLTLAAAVALVASWASAAIGASPPPDTKALDLERAVKAALEHEPPEASRLEQACGGWIHKRLFDEQPLLSALVPACLGRAAMLRQSDDVARQKLAEAISAAAALQESDETAELVARARFWRAELLEHEIAGFERCGAHLGLRRLASWEAARLSAMLSSVASAYQEVARAGRRAWTRRALLRTARLYDGFYRKVASTPPRTYRGQPLPSPFSVDEIDGAALIGDVLAPEVAAWPREIARVYRAVRDEAARAGDDPALLAEAQARLDDFETFEVKELEGARSPWLADLVPGLVRYQRRGFEERTAGGGWRPLADDEARARIGRALSGPVGSVEGAYAMTALASSGIPVDERLLREALAHDDPRVQLAALAALAESPRLELYDALVAYWQGLPADEGQPAFRTLERALFGLRERTLVALARLADRERELAAKLADDARLPARERAYALAELGDDHLAAQLSRLSQTPGDRTTTAVALYGMYLASGRRVAWSLRPGDPDPVGCVSRHLKALDDDDERASPAPPSSSAPPAKKKKKAAEPDAPGSSAAVADPP